MEEKIQEAKDETKNAILKPRISISSSPEEIKERCEIYKMEILSLENLLRAGTSEIAKLEQQNYEYQQIFSIQDKKNHEGDKEIEKLKSDLQRMEKNFRFADDTLNQLMVLMGQYDRREEWADHPTHF